MQMMLYVLINEVKLYVLYNFIERYTKDVDGLAYIPTVCALQIIGRYNG